MTALSFGLIASILRIVSSIASRGVICLVRMSSAKPIASYEERSEVGAAACVAPVTKPAITWPIPVRAKLDDDILSRSRRLNTMATCSEKDVLRLTCLISAPPTNEQRCAQCPAPEVSFGSTPAVRNRLFDLQSWSEPPPCRASTAPMALRASYGLRRRSTSCESDYSD